MGMGTLMGVLMGGGVSEGTLHKWFKGSKSKDGKGGWVNVVTGGTCKPVMNQEKEHRNVFLQQKEQA